MRDFEDFGLCVGVEQGLKLDPTIYACIHQRLSRIDETIAAGEALNACWELPVDAYKVRVEKAINGQYTITEATWLETKEES